MLTGIGWKWWHDIDWNKGSVWKDEFKERLKIVHVERKCEDLIRANENMDVKNEYSLMVGEVGLCKWREK
jgi:hypothetical protein